MTPAPSPSATRGSTLLDAALRPFQQFAHTESLGGVLLLACTALALAAANSPWGGAYARVWKTSIGVGPETHALTLSLRHWIDDGLMAVFFLLVGLEIKRELLVGELASPRQAALPIAGALGGVLLPATLYAAVNAGGPGAPGWGVPMATDIAFALGILTLVAPGAPIGLGVFLSALAIVDDLVAVVVIAVFYTATIHPGPLLAAGAILTVLLGLNRAGVSRLAPYLILGAGLWLAMHESGVHATVAGVLLAMTIPSRTHVDAAAFSTQARALLAEFERGETGDARVITSPAQQEALHGLDIVSTAVTPALLRLEHVLHAPVAFAVMPVFALANAAVSLAALGDVPSSPISLGVVLGLVVGKPAGILLASWLAVRAGLATLPAGVRWGDLHGVAWLGGIGFTMALFVAGLAFGDSPMLEGAKAGVLAGSAIAATVGCVLLRRREAARGRPGRAAR